MLTEFEIGIITNKELLWQALHKEGGLHGRLRRTGSCSETKNNKSRK